MDKWFVLIALTSLSFCLGQEGDEKDEKCCNFRIFEGVNGTGSFIDYIHSPLEFRNAIPWMQGNGLKEFSWICIIKGIFIFYSAPNYDADTASDVKLYSGKGRCDLPGTVNNHLGSIRLSSVTFSDPDTVPYITLFSGLYYSGSIQITVRTHEALRVRGQGIRSFLTVGPAKWSVTAESGKSFCLAPKTDEDKVLVCVIPDATEILKEDPLHLVWSRVTRHDGCPGGDKILIESCFDYEEGEVQDPAVNTGTPGGGNEGNGTSGSGDNITEITTPTAEPETEDPDKRVYNNLLYTPSDPYYAILFNEQTDCDVYVETAFLLRMRLTHDFGDTYQFLLPVNKIHAWRTELLDASFDVVLETGLLPSTLQLQDLLPRVREYFVYVIEKLVWNQSQNDSKLYPAFKPTNELKQIIYETRQCVGKLKGGDLVGSWLGRMNAAISSITESVIPWNLIAKPLRLKDNFNAVLDLVRLTVNTVYFACHQAKKFDTNFWLDYKYLITEMYIRPMKKYRAAKDGPFQHMPLILGGSTLLHCHMMAICTTVIFEGMRFKDTVPDFAYLDEIDEENEPSQSIQDVVG